jgi:hypothetical protein
LEVKALPLFAITIDGPTSIAFLQPLFNKLVIKTAMQRYFEKIC